MAKKSLSNPLPLGMGVDFLPGANVLLIDKDNAPGAAPTVPIIRQFQTLPLVFWGSDNAYPKRIIELAIQSPELLALLEFLPTVIYGQGIGYEIYEKGTSNYIPGFDPEVEAWLTANSINDYLLDLITDLVWFNHGFTELIKNKAQNKICQVGHQEAAFCRFGTQNKTTGYNDFVYINANWPAGSYNDEWTSKVPVINTRSLYSAEETAAAKDFKFIYPSSYPFPGKMVYQLPGWHSLFTSKWFDISLQIPVLKYAMMKFQMTIKYLLEVPEEFWKIQAREQNKVWETMTPQEKTALKKIVKKEMDDFLTGAQNTGKTLMTTFGWDQVNKVKIPGVALTTLDDKLQDGKYIMDSKEASGQFCRSLNLPIPLIGPISSGDMGAGSGADVRMHWNTLNSRLRARKDKAVAALNFCAQFNGWTKRMPGFRFRIKDLVLDTLDQNHSTSNPAPSNAPAKPANNPPSNPDDNADQ